MANKQTKQAKNKKMSWQGKLQAAQTKATIDDVLNNAPVAVTPAVRKQVEAAVKAGVAVLPSQVMYDASLGRSGMPPDFGIATGVGAAPGTALPADAGVGEGDADLAFNPEGLGEDPYYQALTTDPNRMRYIILRGEGKTPQEAFAQMGTESQGKMGYAGSKLSTQQLDAIYYVGGPQMAWQMWADSAGMNQKYIDYYLRHGAAYYPMGDETQGPLAGLGGGVTGQDSLPPVPTGLAALPGTGAFSKPGVIAPPKMPYSSSDIIGGARGEPAPFWWEAGTKPAAQNELTRRPAPSSRVFLPQVSGEGQAGQGRAATAPPKLGLMDLLWNWMYKDLPQKQAPVSTIPILERTGAGGTQRAAGLPAEIDPRLKRSFWQQYPGDTAAIVANAARSALAPKGDYGLPTSSWQKRSPADLASIEAAGQAPIPRVVNEIAGWLGLGTSRPPAYTPPGPASAGYNAPYTQYTPAQIAEARARVPGAGPASGRYTQPTPLTLAQSANPSRPYGGIDPTGRLPVATATRPGVVAPQQRGLGFLPGGGPGGGGDGMTALQQEQMKLDWAKLAQDRALREAEIAAQRRAAAMGLAANIASTQSQNWQTGLPMTLPKGTRYAPGFEYGGGANVLSDIAGASYSPTQLAVSNPPSVQALVDKIIGRYG